MACATRTGFPVRPSLALQRGVFSQGWIYCHAIANDGLGNLSIHRLGVSAETGEKYYDLNMHLGGADDVQVPSELLWQLLLHRQFERESKKAGLDESSVLFGDYNVSEVTEKLIERYDVPKEWFDSLVREGGNENPVEFSKPDTPREAKFRKTWGTRRRDYAVYRSAQEGKTIPEICELIKAEFSEDLDYGNIKKIESNVRHNKLKVGEQIRVYGLKTSKSSRRTKQQRLKEGQLGIE